MQRMHHYGPCRKINCLPFVTKLSHQEIKSVEKLFYSFDGS